MTLTNYEQNRPMETLSSWLVGLIFFFHIKALTAVTLNRNYFIVVVFERLHDFHEVQPSFGALLTR